MACTDMLKYGNPSITIHSNLDYDESNAKLVSI